MKWSEFVVSDWFWAAGAVAVALAALIGSLATFVGGAISRRRNRPEPEWDITFEAPTASTDPAWAGYVGNRAIGRVTNIGDGTAFQVRLTMPNGQPAPFITSSTPRDEVEVVPVIRTGDAMRMIITTDLDIWNGADSRLSWVDPPTRRKKGGKVIVRPYKHHSQPVAIYRNDNGDSISREEWLASRADEVVSEGSSSP